jgi:streptogramin lyase
MRTRKAPRTRTRLGLEALEPRTLLSVATQFSMLPLSSPATAGAPFSVRVTAEDAQGHTVADYLGGGVHFSSSDPRASLPADYTFTAADHGVHAFSGFVFGSAGGQTLTATGDPVGTVTEFATTVNSGPAGITAGPDGNLWFTENAGNKLGKITPAGVVSESPPLPSSGSGPEGITAGPDGNLWFTEFTGNRVGNINPTMPTGITEATFRTADSGPEGITAGPDGNVWFVGKNSGQFGHSTPSDLLIYQGPARSQPYGITAGPDGNLWITEFDGNTVARFIPSTLGFRQFGIPTANSQPEGITAGPDGNLWFVENGGNKVGRITPAGDITEYPIPTANSHPQGITAGPDGNLWFTENAGNKVGKIATGLPRGSTTVYVVATAADHFALTTTAANPDVAGTPFSVTVTAQDPYGNTATGFRGTAHFRSSDPTATLPADYTFTAGDQGAHTFSGVVLRRAGGQTLTLAGSDVSGFATESALPTAASSPAGITAGPDGNLWFTENGANQVGKVTPARAVTAYAIPTFNSQPEGITAGPDGNLWFVEHSGNKVGQLTPAGALTEYPLPTANSQPEGITAGPDGNLWFTEYDGNKVGKITPAGAVTEYPIPTASSRPWGITLGPDGNLWFTEAGASKVGKVTPAGAVTEFSVPTAASAPVGIAAGPDGNLWFVEEFGNKVGRITPGGAVTEYGPLPTANSLPWGITAGPDGNLWFTEVSGNKVGRITPAGALTEYPLPTSNSGPLGITAGADGNLWFTEQNANKLGKITSGVLLGSAAVTVGAAAADHYAVATTAGIVAGTPFNVTVTAQDLYGNTTAGYRGTVDFTSNDTAATLPTDYSFTAADNGVHTFSGVILRTSRYPLVTSITATDTVTGSITGSAGVRVLAAPATHFLLSTAAANPDIAGTPFEVTVTAQDPYGNTDTGYLGTVHFSSADPYGASLPADFSFRNVDQGFHRFSRGATLYTAGTWDVTATDTQSSITGSANVNVIAAPASQFMVSTDAANPDIAGTVIDVTVVASDPYGNTDTNYQGTVHFSSADPYGASLPADYTFQASDQGVATFSGVTALYTAGTWDVTATDAQSGITGAARVPVQAAPAVALQVVAPPSATTGVAFDVTVMAVDPYGNTDMNYTGTIHFTTSDLDPGVMLPLDYTFQASDAGMVTFPGGVTLITLGDQSLTATDTTSGITGTSTVTVTSGGTAPGTGRFPANLAAALREGFTARSPGRSFDSNNRAAAPDRTAVATGEENSLFRAESLGSAAQRAALIDHLWSNPANLLVTDAWIDALVCNERR